jgi:hypothetical protein
MYQESRHLEEPKEIKYSQEMSPERTTSNSRSDQLPSILLVTEAVSSLGADQILTQQTKEINYFLCKGLKESQKIGEAMPP